MRRVGHIDMRAHTKILSALRTDTRVSVHSSYEWCLALFI
jgi:hypothetical protein